MTDEHESNQDKDRVYMGDRTAIIAAGIAIGVSLIAAPGLYTLMNIPIGLVLVVTLHAVDSREDRNRFQSASFALAWAIAFLLIAGLFLVNPYIANNGVSITDNQQRIIDHFTFMELPRFQWIMGIFKDGASDFVSFCIVGVVAAIWYVIRRRLFAVSPSPLPQLEASASGPLQSSAQLMPTPAPTEKKQEHAIEAMSSSTSLPSEAEPLAAKHRSQMPAGGMVTWSILAAVTALCVYIISSKWLKHP